MLQSLNIIIAISTDGNTYECCFEQHSCVVVNNTRVLLRTKLRCLYITHDCWGKAKMNEYCEKFVCYNGFI